MTKRKRNEQIRPAYSAAPLDENTGQQPAFPELVVPSKRDTEWSYDMEEAEIEEEEEGREEEEEDDLVGQTFSLAELDFGEGMEEEEEEEEEVEEGAEDQEMSEGEVEDEWDVEPQTEALAYLHSVRAEAEKLPSLTYVAHKGHLTSGRKPAETVINGITNGSISEPHSWRDQFLGYYNDLRITIAEAPEANLTQDELDELLHIDPNRRPESSAQEDGLWRIKTLDLPSITLLSMLDHQRTIHLLTHLRKKMSANVKKEQCMWLVFLLARLGDPGVLGGDEIDLLRRIGKKCMNVRNSLDEGGDEVVLSTIDMAVCIIKHFYRQMDLEDAV